MPMTRKTMSHFLNRLIKVYPGFKTKIFDNSSFIDNWMARFGYQDEELMNEAAQIWTDRNRFFPTTDEFHRALLVAAHRKTVRDQEEYERTHPTSPEDQRIIDTLIIDLFEGDEDED